MSGRAALVQAFDILMLEIFVGGNIDGYSKMRFAEFVLRLYVEFGSFFYCAPQMMTWWFTTFMAPAIKQKVHNLPGVEYLYDVMSPEQLEIPAYITEYDMTVRIY